MISNSRWFLDTQHSFSFKAEHEYSIRVVHSNSNFNTVTKKNNLQWVKIVLYSVFCTTVSKYTTVLLNVVYYTLDCQLFSQNK